jgi:Ca2+-binding EF-hand superfamily protein
LGRSASLTIKAEGIDFDQFCSILREASLPMLATQEVFNVFSENESGGLVDYLAFLLTLTSFRSDADQMMTTTDANSLQQMARLYFDIFDVDGSGTITFDELKNVMGKLLDRIDPDLVSVSNMTPDEIFRVIDKESKGEISFDEFFQFFNAINTSVSAY